MNETRQERKLDLVERYIHEIGRRLPPKQRADVEAELRSLIMDALEAHSAEAADETPEAAQVPAAALLNCSFPDVLFNAGSFPRGLPRALRPEVMPVLIAAMRALGRPEFNHRVEVTRGVLADTLTIERAGSPFVRTTITLPADQPWLEWTNEADRSLMPEVPPGHASDLYLFGFPFNLPAGGLQFRPETPAGYLTPVADQLPGANGRGWTVQRSAALTAADGYTVVLAAVEPFLFYIGDAEGQGPYSPPANATVYVALMSKADYGLLKGGTWMKLADGEPADVIASPVVQEAYLGVAPQAGATPVQHQEAA